MARPKSDKEIKSINFDKEVLKSLEMHCRKNNIAISSFINSMARNIVMSEYAFYREMSRNAAIELSKCRTLMDTATDKPREV